MPGWINKRRNIMETNNKQTKRNDLNIWAVVAILGLLLAVCTVDDSTGEIGLRLIGLACFFIGAYFGGYLNESNEVNDLNDLQNNENKLND